MEVKPVIVGRHLQKSTTRCNQENQIKMEVKEQNQDSLLEAHPKVCDDYYYKCLRERNIRIYKKRIYVYEADYWKLIPDSEEEIWLRSFFTRESRGMLSSGRVKNILLLLKEDPDLQKEFPSRNTGKIPFLNGTYNIGTGKLEKTDPESYFSYMVNAKYKKECSIQDAPAFLQFARTSLDYDTMPEKVQILLQYIGYCISDYTVAKKAFFLIGEPSSGKSVMLSFLKEILPDECVTNINFSEIGNRFNVARLFGTHLNISPELSGKSFPKLEIFKAVVSSDHMMGERKGQDGFDFQPTAKLISAGNMLPITRTADYTDAVFQRMAVLRFSHSLPRESWDVHLLDKLLAERDIILSLAVEKLIELKNKNFEFEVSSDSELYIEEYKRSQNPFPTFISDSCEFSFKFKESTLKMWDAYVRYCDQNALEPHMNTDQFRQSVLMLEGVKPKTARHRLYGGNPISCFEGIRLKGDFI